MSVLTNVRANDPAILAYHATLQQYADHGASHEGATETAFSHLLAITANFSNRYECHKQPDMIPTAMNNLDGFGRNQ